MSASIKLRLGNLFDGPTDLIVLPCSTGGTVSDFVARSLKYYRLPQQPASLKLGDIYVVPFEGGRDIAQYVAFAASVHAYTSDAGAIFRIGSALGSFTASNASVRAVSSPLLGARAGGMQSEVVVDSLHRGFVGKASPNATLTISILHKQVYNRFAGKARTPGRGAPVRVFISYTGGENERIIWVEKLANFLRNEGVETRLDRWNLMLGADLPQWMANELKLADKVLIISDERYAEKADGRLGGVGWETMLIQGDMMMSSSQSATNNPKYILIVCSDDVSLGTPVYLRTKYALHWHARASEASMRDDLLRNLYAISSEPQIGSPQIFLA
jgi:SEFIR domain-containing protein